jgi:hypothetical protein
LTPGPRPGGRDDTAELIGFIRMRLNADERQAHLFHEPACTVPNALAHQEGCGRCGRRWRCRCPVPGRLIDRARALRRILHHCEALITGQASEDPCWPRDPLLARPALRILAQRWENHPGWREHWSL